MPPEEKLPPEMARIRRIDRELHLTKAREAGLTEREARKHTRSEMQERRMLEHAEPQTPGKPLAKSVPDRSGKPGKRARAPRAAPARARVSPRAKAAPRRRTTRST